MKKIFLLIPIAFSVWSCIKPYACECTTNVTKQKHHVLIYASKFNRDEACKKNAVDTTETCALKN